VDEKGKNSIEGIRGIDNRLWVIGER
jgi:hypothetical protein